MRTEDIGDAVLIEGGKVNDALRYTVILNSGNYRSSEKKIIEDLKAKGYEFTDYKDAWSAGNTYKGVNATFKDSRGTSFEVQFHTKQSYAAKTDNHALYEEWRAASTLPDRKKVLGELMQQRWVNVPTPT